MQRSNFQKGSLLIEILIAISAFAIVAAIAAQTTMVGLRSSQAAGDKTVASNLLSEMSAGMRGATDEKWANLYGLAKDGTKYHLSLVSGKWAIAQGDEVVSVNGMAYDRYFTVSNVSRDPATRDIEASYNSSHDDPSTQRVDMTVSASTTDPLAATEYFFRWRNKVCDQTAWTASGSSGVKTCPDSSYASQTNLTTGASLKLNGAP